MTVAAVDRGKKASRSEASNADTIVMQSETVVTSDYV